MNERNLQNNEGEEGREGGRREEEASSSVCIERELSRRTEKQQEGTRASQRPRTEALVPFGKVWCYVVPCRKARGRLGR